MGTDQHGSLFVVSAPSGAGKHTILGAVLSADPGIEYSVSATTRDPRPGETDGQDYFFLSEQEFERRVGAGDFLEWANVHGNRYGTLRGELERHLASGKDVVIQIDVQGVRSLRRDATEFVSVFVAPPSLEELEQRLVMRGTDRPEAIEQRVRNAHAELAAQGEYDHVIINDKLERAIADFQGIVRGERCRRGRQDQEHGE